MLYEDTYTPRQVPSSESTVQYRWNCAPLECQFVIRNATATDFLYMLQTLRTIVDLRVI